MLSMNWVKAAVRYSPVRREQRRANGRALSCHPTVSELLGNGNHYSFRVALFSRFLCSSRCHATHTINSLVVCARWAFLLLLRLLLLLLWLQINHFAQYFICHVTETRNENRDGQFTLSVREEINLAVYKIRLQVSGANNRFSLT